MIAASLGNFTKEVMEAEKLVLVDFGTVYCGPCKAMHKTLQSVETEGHKVVTVDIDDEPDLTEHYEISALPTLLLFKNGEVVGKLVGIQPKQAILDLIAKTAA